MIFSDSLTSPAGTTEKTAPKGRGTAFMKTFCTEGPVDPVRNYFVSRKSLLKQGLAKVDDWRYFTLFAPRQSGKSTYFQFLVEYIRQEGRLYLPLWLSFEAYSDFDMADFISRLSHDLMLELETVEPERTVSSPFLKKLIDLGAALLHYTQ